MDLKIRTKMGRKHGYYAEDKNIDFLIFIETKIWVYMNYNITPPNEYQYLFFICLWTSSDGIQSSPNHYYPYLQAKQFPFTNSWPIGQDILFPLPKIIGFESFSVKFGSFDVFEKVS